jgi:hypothetical protein
MAGSGNGPLPGTLKAEAALTARFRFLALRLEVVMPPRANWKGYLKLSLVTCLVALFPASKDTTKQRLPAKRSRAPRRSI